MSARYLTTALPFALDDDAPFHLTAFVSHRLEPDGDTTLAEFPAVMAWVTTLKRGTWLVSASSLPEPVPATVVSEPDQGAWKTLLPKTTLVRGYPQPRLSTATWHSYPAHAMDEIAGSLHLAAVLTSPATRPAVDNVVTRAVLSSMSHVHQGARGLLSMLDNGKQKPRYSKSYLDAMATLNAVGLRPGMASHGVAGSLAGDDMPAEPNAVELLLQTQAADEKRLTEWLDQVAADDRPRDGMLGAMVDVHRARRYYQRPAQQPEYAARPVEGATTPPVENPVPDFHQLASSAGSTPALLRRLGLAVDLTVAAEHRAALRTATWVSVAFVPDDRDELEAAVPPQTLCEHVDGAWRATSGGEWSSGRLPLADLDHYTVLSLDPDATGLATEQNLRNLVGEVASAVNGDVANGAPTALRSTGFSLARLDRVDATRERLSTAESMAFATSGRPLRLTYEQIVRGMRLQVRRDAEPWRSVHQRRVQVTAADGATVLADAPDAGYLPLTSMSRSGAEDDEYYLHEVFAGWDGWSLSAPRPGKVVVHGPDGEEQILDEPPSPDADSALGKVRSTPEPGTLPRLRYGSSYSFRITGVDLAGNEVREAAAPTGPASRPGPGSVRGRASGATISVDDLRRTAATRRVTSLGPQLRDALAKGVRTIRDDDPFESAKATSAGSAFRPRLADAAKEVAGESLVIAPSRIAQTERNLADLVGAETIARTTVSDLGRLRSAVESVIGNLDDLHVRPDLLDGVVGGAPEDSGPAKVADSDTLPMPFLRWQPVPPPALVARHELTPGESLQRLVIREGETTERHVVPPKTSQLEAELHGRFDAAIGSTDPAVQRAAYGWALRERGTLLDQFVPDLDHPGQSIEQPGMSLASRPGANPDTAVTLAEITANRDTQIGEGQYVVHDVDQLVLPYLPDPLAAGLALVFIDAGAPHTLPDPRVLSAVVVPFAGDWPRTEPLRLVLEPGDELGSAVEGNVIRVQLPAGEQVRVAMSTSLRAEDLDALGLWRTTTTLLGGAGNETVLALLQRAAVSGWTWWLTPSDDMRLVHATPRPARPPVLHDLALLARPAGATVAALFGITDVHGASTARLSVEATWSEWVDDVTTPGPVRVDRRDVPVRSLVAEGERYGLLFPWDDPDPDEPDVPKHRAIQTFADTHHRTVDYTLIGSTRYAEFFAPGDAVGDDDPASRSEPSTLSIPSSARPAAPVVVETVPLIMWDAGTEPDQPFARRRTRRSGARLWLSRPWFSSGDGELLAVVHGPGLPATTTSQWGRDPGLLQTAAVPSAAQPPLLTATDLLFTASDLIAEPGTDADLPPRPGGPVLAAQPQKLVDVAEQPKASLLGYAPEFHPDRRQWFVDIAMTPPDQLWPFVRLAVARYQPDSLDDRAVSPVVMTDWVQPLPERTATVSRPDATHVHVTVSGAAATYRGTDREHPEPGYEWAPDTPWVDVPASPLDAALLPSRVMVATVQARGESDLEWQDRAKVRLPAVGQDPERIWQVTWSERLELPEAVSLETPEHSEESQYRVLIEELEVMQADADPAPKGPPQTRVQTRRVTRLVYADTFDL